MKLRIASILSGLILPCAAIAANEGVPSYYQTAATQNANQASYGQYAAQGYTKYVGQSGNKQVINSRSYSYQVPRQTTPQINGTTMIGGAMVSGTMTPNGIAIPVENRTNIYAGYTRRFADFEFETGVNSILEWDDMVFNEITVGARHNFSLRNFDMFAFGEYSYGDMSHGGLSMDYDLEPFDSSNQYDGIFTISMGDQTGKSHHFRFGLGAHHIWDIGGWKLSPSIGYEIFKHNLEMSNHLYPNPGIYLPLLTYNGEYVYGDEYGYYYSLPIGAEVPDNWYQVCMSPQDIKVVGASGDLGDALTTVDYDVAWGDYPWGVGPDDCVVIGGDGPILVEGTTHIYDTTWSGFYIGLEVEKQMTLTDKLRFYVQFGLPKYSSEGIWPNRDDWQQNPSFIDEGSNGAYTYTAEMEYNMRLSDRIQLVLRADTNVFHVGKIGGELYIAEYTEWAMDENGQYLLDDNGLPYLVTTPAYTEKVDNSLTRATWQSFGLHLGVKVAF